MIEDLLGELGCQTVWQAGNVRQALALLDERSPDAVVLDANLGGEFAYPIAARLAASDIPFVFATGYGREGIPGEWASRPVIQKPFSQNMLEEALRSMLPGRPAAP
ncbi:MAG: response regulator [Rhizobiales bacterium]|nr:response regulator [Hyphomicrobiales bacterium]